MRWIRQSGSIWAELLSRQFSTRTRRVFKDFVFLSIDTFIFKTDIYQRWLRERSGTENLRGYFREDFAAAPQTLEASRAPSLADWETLGADRKRSAEHVTAATVDVVMPVFLGYTETLNAIYAVLASTNQTPFELIVINDASPDATLAAMLRNLAAEGWFTLIEHAKNKGFVASANEGFAQHASRDVLLLNSDTEVYHNWLDRMRACAERHPEAGTFTPLSNNASICSYPRFAKESHEALEVDHRTLDALAANANAQRSIEIPTAVGFCMLIRRDCLKQIGHFDTKTFRTGYGEENDFCLRATQWGWKHRLVGDTYVQHYGGRSFGESKRKRERRAWQILTRRYPHYREAVRQFLRSDPMKPIRQRLDLARLQRYAGHYNILMVSHTSGGGTERHVHEMVQTLAEEGIGAFLLTAAPGGRLQLSHHAVPLTPNARFSMEFDRQVFYEALLELGIRHVHIHHLLGFPSRFVPFLEALCKELGGEYDMTLHDYYPICPRINLIDGSGSYCGEPEVSVCELCITVNPSHAQELTAWEWRLRHLALMRGARSVFVPDQDVMQRMKRYVPEANFKLRPHADYFDTGINLASPLLRHGEVLKIGLLGMLSDAKGAEIVAALVKDAKARKLPVRYVLIGETEQEVLCRERDYFSKTGPYAETALPDLIRTHAPHYFFFPSVWPETYSYTLSIAWRFGIHPVVLDLGAPASRIRAAGPNAGTVLPFELSKNIEELSYRLLNLRVPKETARPRNQDYFSLMDYYYTFNKIQPLRA